MIFTIVILLLLGRALLRGFHRGFVIEVLHLIGTIGVLVFARLLYQPLGTALTELLINLKLVTASATSSLIINLVAFFLLSSFGWTVVRVVARVSRSVTWLPVIKQVNSLAGGAVAFALTYLVLFVVLSLANLVQTDFIQTQMAQSPVATFMVERTPGLTSQYLGDVFKFNSGLPKS